MPLKNKKLYNLYLKEWRNRNPGRHDAHCRKYNARIKGAVFAYYGNKCSCCGETEPVFLTLEHLDGGGASHRRKMTSNQIYNQIIKIGFPPNYTILCMNCNWGKYMSDGSCPHVKKKAQEWLSQIREIQKVVG